MHDAHARFLTLSTLSARGVPVGTNGAGITEEYVVGIGPKDIVPAGAGANGELPFVLVMSAPLTTGLSDLCRGNADSVKSYGELLEVIIGPGTVNAFPSGTGCAYVGIALRKGEVCGTDPDQKAYGDESDVSFERVMLCIAIMPGEYDALNSGGMRSPRPAEGTLLTAKELLNCCGYCGVDIDECC